MENPGKITPAKTEPAKKTQPEAASEQELKEAELYEAVGGSQSTGSGTSKMSFNPFSIKGK